MLLTSGFISFMTPQCLLAVLTKKRLWRGNKKWWEPRTDELGIRGFRLVGAEKRQVQDSTRILKNTISQRVAKIEFI
jgi:hypothetical protein